MKKEYLKVFSGSSNKALAEKVCKILGIEPGKAELSKFKDGEVNFQILENVRGRDVFVIQSASYEVNFHILELLVMIDAFRRASARSVTAVIPYYGYARQDRKDKPRVPISARLIANLLEAAGVDRVLTMDLHAPQIQGFFSVPVDNLYAFPVLVKYFKSLKLNKPVVVSPDAGGVERARIMANALSADLAMVYKKRIVPNEVAESILIGDVKGRDVIIIDDIVDTGGTLVKTVKLLKEHEADRIWSACTHPILSEDSVDKINSSALEELIVTDTIQIPESKQSKKIKVLSVSDLFAEAIRRIFEQSSVSSIFQI
ncbi:MAG: ribose-phosphate diphosphokinase [Candidatus Aminicenantia bacterium]